MKNIGITLLLILLLPNKIYAENASVLLDLYNLEPTVSIHKERLLLKNIGQEYYLAKTNLNRINMLEDSININDLHHTSVLNDYNIEILELESALSVLKTAIYESRESSVEHLLALDAQYQSLMDDLQHLLENKQLLTKQQGLLTLKTEDIQKKQALFDQLEKKFYHQKKKYEHASSFPELGDIYKVKFPLNKPTYLTSSFGERLDPITKEDIEFHTGIDLHAKINTEVTALFHGKVAFVGFSETLGNYIILNHGKGIRTIYGHLNNSCVSNYQEVKQYDIIAYSGNTGSRTTGPHLHFGLYINEVAVDPNKLFQ